MKIMADNSRGMINIINKGVKASKFRGVMAEKRYTFLESSQRSKWGNGLVFLGNSAYYSAGLCEKFIFLFSRRFAD
jgi:hypothetical protein